MNSKIVKELQAIKFILANVVGTSTLPERERFSTEALDKAAGRFQKLSIERGDWIKQWDIDKIIKNAPIMLVRLFGLNLGLVLSSLEVKKYYYNKSDLLALAKELKDRNIDLKSYMDLLADEEKFRKSLESVSVKQKGSRGKKFSVPYDIKDILSSPQKAPSPDVIRGDIKPLIL